MSPSRTLEGIRIEAITNSYMAGFITTREAIEECCHHSQPDKTACTYCARPNDRERDTCAGCGAPLPITTLANTLGTTDRMLSDIVEAIELQPEKIAAEIQKRGG